MNIYTIAMAMCTGFATFEVISDGNSRYRFVNLYLFLVASAFLLFMAAFRQCGFDYYNYLYYFDQLDTPNWFRRGNEIGSEPAYSLLNYLLGSYAAVIAVMSAAIITLQFTFVRRYSMMPLLSLVFYLGLFMYPSTMGQFRQGLAVGIAIWAIASRDNLWKFFLLIGLAMTFHISAGMALLAIVMPRRMLSLWPYIAMFVGALAFSVIAERPYLNAIDSLPGFLADKAQFYAKTERTALGLNTAVMIRAFVFFACYYFRDKLRELPMMPYFANIYFLSLIIYTALGFAPQVAGRGSIYFAIFEVILVANLIYAVKDWRRYVLLAIFVGISAFRQINFFNEWATDYIPYKNWVLNMFLP